MPFLTLDSKGLAASLFLALGLLALGGSLGLLFVLLMLYFLTLSAAVTWIGINKKKAMGLYQPTRGMYNVMANGAGPLIMAAAFFVSGYLGSAPMTTLSAVGFIASVAAITADKFGSELGVLDGMPRMIFTLRKVKRGVSGGVTWLGLAAGLLGSALIALAAFAFVGSWKIGGPYVFLAVLLSGFIGTLVDSVLGYYEERGIGNKYTSNFVCSVAGAAASVLILLLIGMH